jgi:hypothetical protein
MHTVEILSHTIAFAESLGYGIRHEWLGGATGGACEIAGKRWLFIDLALSPMEQLDQVVEALKRDGRIYVGAVPEPLRGLLDIRRAG